MNDGLMDVKIRKVKMVMGNEKGKWRKGRKVGRSEKL